MPNSRLSAIAAPTNSARSVAIAISSAWTHRPNETPAREVLAAQLGQAAPGRDADLGRQELDQHRHQVRDEDHPQQQVAELGAAGDVGGEVAGVDVGDRGHERRADERQRGADAAAALRVLERPRRDRGFLRAHAWTLIAPASEPPSTCTASPKRTNSGPSNGCFSTTSNASPGSDPAVGEVAQHLGVGVGDPHEHAAGAGLGGGEALGLELLDHEVGGRDRVAVRVARRVAELGRDQRLELLGEHVLEHLGLVVHAVPRHAEALGEVELEQPVVADHLERHARALGGQLHAPVGHVLHQPELVELADHARRRGRRDVQPLGQRVRADGAAGALGELVDRLGVVLDGGAEDCFSR